MKKTFTILIFLIVLHISVFSQTKIDEFPRISGHDMTGHLDALITSLIENPTSKALIIIYSGSKLERYGNINGIISGIKWWDNVRADGKFGNRILTVIAKGKTQLAQEYWIIKEGEELPHFERADANFDNLNEKNLFAEQCITCEEEYGNLSGSVVDWDLLGKILKNNPKYKLLVTIYGSDAFDEKGNTISSKKYYKNLRNHLSQKFQIKKKRFMFKHHKFSKEKYAGTASFYIVPSKK